MSEGKKDARLTGELFVEGMSAEERARASRVESVLPELRKHAQSADESGEFYRPHIQTLSQAGLLGLIIPTQYGGLGGGLRDLAAATFAMGSACPSTALAYFFHCSSASRGLLALEALDAGLFSPDEEKIVRPFADKVLTRMGRHGKWLANFASESNKSAKAAVTISTEAKKVPGGYSLKGVKSFGCATGVADHYLVTAKLEGTETAEGLAVFFVAREAKGVKERVKWDAIGMRATATHGLILEDVFVPDDEALALPGAFVKMMQMSRGSFVGNQLAGTACYLGAAQAVYDSALDQVRSQKFGDTGESVAMSPMHQDLIGQMTVDLEVAYLWMRRQLELESSASPILTKDRVVMQWRLCKGEVAEACFRVSQSALKMCGTSGTDNKLPYARALRDTAMGLVQAFPRERGRLEVAKMVASGTMQAAFGTK
jgi:alkylation response protein AidB-like acyl-CoA dehydrogenase